jgi:hypothetical protein
MDAPSTLAPGAHLPRVQVPGSAGERERLKAAKMPKKRGAYPEPALSEANVSAARRKASRAAGLCWAAPHVCLIVMSLSSISQA